nr:MAG TPA: hypothetical protein [Caudoviricetes sp.]
MNLSTLCFFYVNSYTAKSYILFANKIWQFL